MTTKVVNKVRQNINVSLQKLTTKENYYIINNVCNAITFFYFTEITGNSIQDFSVHGVWIFYKNKKCYYR